MKVPFCDTHQKDMFKTSFGVYICRQCWFQRTNEQNYAELFKPEATESSENTQRSGSRKGSGGSHE